MPCGDRPPTHPVALQAGGGPEAQSRVRRAAWSPSSPASRRPRADLPLQGQGLRWATHLLLPQAAPLPTALPPSHRLSWCSGPTGHRHQGRPVSHHPDCLSDPAARSQAPRQPLQPGAAPPRHVECCEWAGRAPAAACEGHLQARSSPGPSKALQPQLDATVCHGKAVSLGWVPEAPPCLSFLTCKMDMTS